jgi:AraC family transcriptional regulator
MRPQTQRSHKERILRVLVYIQEHLRETIALDDLARIAHFSPYHFHRLFRGMVGESVMEHIRRLRLEQAAHQLKFTEQPVTRIAFDAGYETHEAFTRAFHAMFELSPSQFREAQRALPFRAVPSGVHFVDKGQLQDFQPSQTGALPMEVRIERVAPMRVAFVRHVGPYNQVGAAWARLMSWAAPKGLFARRLTMLGIVYDDPEVTPADKVRYDACVTVDESIKPEGDIGVQEVGGGDFAVATHRGPYDKLGDTYARLCGQWLPSSGREARSAPSFEIYHNSPFDTLPADLLTDVYVPLEVE